jgi:hypothetical protein
VTLRATASVQQFTPSWLTDRDTLRITRHSVFRSIAVIIDTVYPSNLGRTTNALENCEIVVMMAAPVRDVLIWGDLRMHRSRVGAMAHYGATKCT